MREIEPATRVDVELWNADGRYLGVLARMRDVLPGHYVFGLTGRSPAGVSLTPGAYKLRIVVVPSGGGTAISALALVHGRPLEEHFGAAEAQVGKAPK